MSIFGRFFGDISSTIGDVGNKFVKKFSCTLLNFFNGFLNKCGFFWQKNQDCQELKNSCKSGGKFGRKSKNLVSVLSIEGVIGGSGSIGGKKSVDINSCDEIIEKAFFQKHIKAVCVLVNSPGGSPVQSELIYRRIREISEEKKIPVYTFAQDVAASGGYFILCAGDEIFASASSVIGSIGVVSGGFGLEDAIGKLGIKRRLYSEGKFKAVLDPFLPENESGIMVLKDIQKDIFENFVDIVKNARKDKLKAANADIFNGAFWSGKKALSLGLIDGVGNMREVMKFKYGEKVKYKFFTRKKSFLSKIGINTESSTDLIDNFINKIEEKIVMSRFMM